MIHSIQEMLAHIKPLDALEQTHLHFANDWIDSGAGIFRIAKPATPDPHLVAYFVLLDPVTNKILLVDHKKAGLWLPAGGHVELDEHPRDTVKREVLEELAIEADFLLDGPFFLTVTQTTDRKPHTDVSLWYLLKGSAEESYQFDAQEFHQIRWFLLPKIPYEMSDPHMRRCVEKLTGMITLKDWFDHGRMTEAVAKLPHPGKSMILTSIARTGSPVRSVLTRSFPGWKPSQNGCNGRQKGGFPVAGSFATASLVLHESSYRRSRTSKIGDWKTFNIFNRRPIPKHRGYQFAHQKSQYRGLQLL